MKTEAIETWVSNSSVHAEEHSTNTSRSVIFTDAFTNSAGPPGPQKTKQLNDLLSSILFHHCGYLPTADYLATRPLTVWWKDREREKKKKKKGTSKEQENRSTTLKEVRIIIFIFSKYSFPVAKHIGKISPPIGIYIWPRQLKKHWSEGSPGPAEKPGTMLMRAQVPGVARVFPARVNFQCRLCYGVHTTPARKCMH